MSTLLQDLRLGLRSLRRSPGFTATSVVILALGIGANTAIFSLVRPILFEPLPLPDPEAVAVVEPVDRATGEGGMMSFPDFQDWQPRATTLESVAAFQERSVAIGGPGEPSRERCVFTTDRLFAVYGHRPLLGRGLTPLDAAGGAPVAVISRALWLQRFGGRQDALGESLQVEGKPFTVVGVVPDLVMPGTTLGAPKVWVPLQADPDVAFLQDRGHHHLRALARRKAGVPLAQVNGELDVLSRQLEVDHPDENEGVGLRARPLDEALLQEERPLAQLMLVAVGLVLLIACSNVGSLLLARATARRRELSVRLALGASRAQVVQQLLTESLLLGLMGAGLGLFASAWLTDLLAFWLRLNAPASGLSLPLLAFAGAMGVFTSLLFGLLPALGVQQVVAQDLKDGSAAASAGRRTVRLQGGFIVAQVALAFGLLVAAALMIQSLRKLSEIQPGFDPSNVVVLKLPLPEWTYPRERKLERYRSVLEQAAALPGVESVGAVDPFPFQDGSSRLSGLYAEGAEPASAAEALSANMYEISDGYFDAMKVPLLEGRTFSPAEQRERRNVVVINTRFAHRLFGDASALGKRVQMEGGLHEVIGVVGDVRHSALEREPPSQLYVPYQHSKWLDMSVVVRGKVPPEQLIPALRQLVRDADATLPLNQLRPASLLLEQSTGNRRGVMMLLASFAALALTLAMVGLYGVVGYAVGQRQRELAIRVALGAQGSNIRALVLGGGLRLLALGLLAGVALAVVLGRLLTGLLYGVTPSEPVTLLAVAGLLVLAALAACAGPVRRATSVDPIDALRSE